MTHVMSLTETPSHATAPRAAVLRRRAAGLRDQADELDPVLAETYRRRAAEMELEAWVCEVRSGVPADSIRGLAA